MPDLIHCRWALRGGVYTADDVRGFILSGVAAGESFVSGIRVGVGGGVAGKILSGPAWEVSAPSVNNTTRHAKSQAIYGIINYRIRFHWVYTGGLQGEGENAHQPPDPLLAPPRVGHNSDSVGRETPPPMMPGL